MSKIIRVQDGDFKIIVNRPNLNAEDQAGTGNDNSDRGGNIILHTGPQSTDGFGIGNTFVSGDLTVDGGDIFSTNTDFNLLNRRTSESTTEDGVQNIYAFLNAETVVINDNRIQENEDLNSASSQTIRVGNSQAQTQVVEIGNSTATANQHIKIGNSNTPTQRISIGILTDLEGGLIENNLQTIDVGSGNVRIQNIAIGQSTTSLQNLTIGSSSTAPSQNIYIGHNVVTTGQVIKFGSQLSNNETQTVDIASSSSSSVSQFGKLFAAITTPDQDIEIATGLSSNLQRVKFAATGTNATTKSKEQVIEIGKSFVSTSQVVNVASSGNSNTQTINIGTAQTTPTQTVSIASDILTNSSQSIKVGSNFSTATQTIVVADSVLATASQTAKFAANATTPIQTVEIATGTSPTKQEVKFANTTAGLQNVEIAKSVVSGAQTVSFASDGTSSTQSIKVASSESVGSQSLSIASNLTNNSTQVVSLASSFTTTGQTVNIADSVSSASQSINIASNGTSTISQTVKIANTGSASTSSAQQLVEIAKSFVSTTQQVDFASNGSATQSQTVTIANGTSTPTQRIKIGNLLSNSEQELLIGNSASSTKQTVKIASSSTPIQELEVGVTTASTRQLVNIANAITPDQTINLGVSTISGQQTVNVANTTALQTVNIGSTSTKSSTYNVATGPTDSGNTKTVNIGTSGLAGSITNVNVATGQGTGGTLTIGSQTVVGEEQVQNLWNTVATTVNAFGDATVINIGKGLGGSGQGTTTIRHDVVVQGDLTVNGTTTTVNSTVMTVDDKNIELGSVLTPTEFTAEGGGVTLKGLSDKTFNWYGVSNAWTSNVNLDLLVGHVYKIDNIEVLSSTGVLNYAPEITAFASSTLATLGSTTGITNIRNNLDVDLNIEVGGDILPTLNESSDIGSPTNRFKDIYLSGNSIHLGDAIISSDTTGTETNGIVHVDHGIVVQGNADFNATGYLKVPKGTTAQRPGEVDQPPKEAGQIRFNTTKIFFEGYDGIKWKRLGVDIDTAEQLGSYNTFIMDKFETNLYQGCEYTISMQNLLSTHWVKINVIHNGYETTYTKVTETISGAECATIETRLNNGFVEVLLTPHYDATEVIFSRMLLDASPSYEGTLTFLPADDLDMLDFETNQFNIDLMLENSMNSTVDLNLSRVPGSGGILPMNTLGVTAIDFETTSYYVDFNIPLNSNLLNNNRLVDKLVQCVPTNEPGVLDLEVYNYYIHPDYMIVLETPSTTN